jgi:iron only hydrogenase large subunit-like protein
MKMHGNSPIFTERNECQDCYKCIRGCPVKAIKIENGVASVIENLCILCGTCVNICPAEAKKVRNDSSKAKELIRSGARVVMSLAPSWICEFPGLDSASLIAAVKSLGFNAVSETALGAEAVSASCAKLINPGSGKSNTLVSSACPVVVEYISKYRPELLPMLAGMFSPLIAHCRIIKREYGKDCKVVFAGPCIGKKMEAAANGNLLSAALTFKELRQWMADAGVVPSTIKSGAEDIFVPGSANEGAFYPIDGGMLAGIRSGCTINDPNLISLSGMENVIESLADGIPGQADKGIFLELLACRGGCVNGPGITDRRSLLKKRIDVISAVELSSGKITHGDFSNITAEYYPKPVPSVSHTEEQIVDMLRKTGKNSKADELNCGACGYNSCRSFAEAVMELKAETSMCATYMRKLALNKANKLIKTMPSAVVIVNEDLEIIECNFNFARLAGTEVEEVYKVCEGLPGADIEKIMPLSDMFRQTLESGEDIVGKSVRIKGRILQCSLFSIERGAIVGGIFNDVTEPLLKKEEITKRTRKVIDGNLKTVQKIAYLLGENAAETEMALSSILDAFNSGNRSR